jgi:hypothetical protein
MSTRWIAWIRRYWPILLAAVFVLSLFLDPSQPLTAMPWYHAGAWTPLQFPVFLGIFLGMRWLLTGRRRVVGVALTAGALLLQAGAVYLNFHSAISYSSAWIDDLRPGANPRIAKLPARAMEIKNGKGGHQVARFYFRQTGIPVLYRDDSGRTLMYEPTAEDSAAWEGLRAGSEEREWLRPQFEQLAATFRFRGYVNLELGGVAILLALALPWRQRKAPQEPSRT